MFGIGVPELVIILVLVLVIFGAGKVPQVMSQMGKGIRDFRLGVTEIDAPDIAEKEAEPNEEEKTS